MTLAQVNMPPHATSLQHSQSMGLHRRKRSISNLSKGSSNFNYGHAFNPPDAGVIFEEAVTREAKAELTEQIKEELQEDFELKLHQKDIEMQIRLGEQKDGFDAKEQEIIQKYETLIKQYEADLEAALNAARRNSVHTDPLVMLDNEDTKTSEVDLNTRKIFTLRDDEQGLDPDDTTIPLINRNQFDQTIDDVEEMKAQLKADTGFYLRVERLFSDSTLLW